MMQQISTQALVPVLVKGQRFDAIAVQLFPDYSRGQLQSWIKAGELTVDGHTKKPNAKLVGGEKLSLNATLVDVNAWLPEDIAIDVVFEDAHILVINKPAGLVVHPAAGNYTGTLLNALLHHYPASALIPRAGIVHRLDKDTTGLMVVAKTLQAQNNLVQQLQARTASRRYFAIAIGELKKGGVVDAAIGRDPKNRIRMAVVSAENGKEAITHYDIAARYPHFTLLKLKLDTGRTHQIRVHMAHLGYGLVGDTTYKGRGINLSKLREPVREVLASFNRQALHAAELGLLHPVSGEYSEWKVPLPADFSHLMAVLSGPDND
ncbi:MAG: 23S rRNA pseudouridine(1911/1915/1917) synthase RluD [Marinagarivorans sp.]|nr:23S rRNA pseudouridine(1911/1915/1917) synthase RluD [Marinagarivorans sp.]